MLINTDLKLEEVKNVLDAFFCTCPFIKLHDAASPLRSAHSREQFYLDKYSYVKPEAYSLNTAGPTNVTESCANNNII